VFQPHLGDLVSFVATESATGSAAADLLTLRLPASSSGMSYRLLKLDKQASWKELEQASNKVNLARCTFLASCVSSCDHC
jgi:hypothetical protein